MYADWLPTSAGLVAGWAALLLAAAGLLAGAVRYARRPPTPEPVEEPTDAAFDPRYLGAYDDRLLDPGDLDELLALVRRDPWDDRRLLAVAARLYDGADGPAVERRAAADVAERLDARVDRTPRVKKAARAAEDRLAELDGWFAALDRRAFLVFAQMADRLGGSELDELVERYRFHLAVQEVYRAARWHQRKADFFVRLAAGREFVPGNLFADLSAALRDARTEVAAALTAADAVQSPDMIPTENVSKHLIAGSLARDPGTDRIPAAWTRKFLDQLEEVRANAARLHVRSLRALLLAQQRIADDFRATAGL